MRGRSPSTEPVKISRPPSPITRAAARAPRNAPVRFTSRTCRQTDGSVSSGPPTMGEIPALQIQASTPPHSATVASATASLKCSSVTSPLSTRRRPRQRLGDALRSRSVRATRATDAPAREKAWASTAPRPRPAPVSTTRFPATAPGPGNDAGISIGSVIMLPVVVPVSTVPSPVTAGPPSSTVSTADLVEMHRRMLLIRGFEQRVSALYRDGEVPGFVHLSIGQEATAVGACWPLRARRRDHVHPPRPRSLPGQGAGPARDVRRADGQGRGHQPRSGRFDAHRRPDPRDLRRQRDRGGGHPDRGGRGDGRAAPSRWWRGGGVLRRRRAGPRRLPRGDEPGGRVAPPGGVLLREQRLRRVLAGVRPARRHPRAPSRWVRRPPTWRSTATTSRPSRR